MNHLDLPRRQRLGVGARREAILAAATQAFAGAGYEQVSVASIGAAAGVSEALVFKYFGGKAGLYASVVQAQLEQLAERQRAALSALPANTSARDQLRVVIEAFLDHVQQLAATWANPFVTAPSEPEPVQRLRSEYQARFVEALNARLPPHHGRRDRLALVGFVGFLSAVSHAWAEQGCPPDDRAPLVTATLGALQGALGDWGVLG